MQDTSLIVSASATALGIASTISGDQVMSIVMLVINIATLLVNTGITLYRKIRDRDSDLKNKEDMLSLIQMFLNIGGA